MDANYGPRRLSIFSLKFTHLFSILVLAFLALLTVPRLTSHSLVGWSGFSVSESRTLPRYSTSDEHALQILEKSLLIIKGLLAEAIDQG